MSSGGYIYCKALGGLNDVLCQLWICTEYAIKHNRSIIFEIKNYPMNIFEVFDFSKYPVPIFSKDKLNELKDLVWEPTDTTSRISCFNKNNIYPNNILLIHRSSGGGSASVNVFKHIKLKPVYANMLKDRIAGVPKEYNAIHIRGMDMGVLDLDYVNNKIDKFIGNNPIQVFISTDDKHILDGIHGHSNIFFSKSDLKTTKRSLHIDNNNPNHLIDAIFDLYMLSKSIKLLSISTTYSGFCGLAKHLQKNKENLSRFANF